MSIQYVLVSILTIASVGCSKSKSPSPAMESTGSLKNTPDDKLSASQRLDKAIEIAFDTVYFDFDSHVLTAPAQENLRNLAKALKVNPGVKIQIEGHSDERGSNEYNLALGDKRAQSIKSFLVSEGIAERDIVTASMGEEKPADRAHSEEAWAKNRRGIFTRIN